MKIQTRSGVMFEPGNPRIEDVKIGDIAFALSRICRWAGHCPFYSVAQHSVKVSQQLPENLALAGLLHDAAEAYLGDIPRPLKKHMQYNGEPFAVVEERLLKVIFEAMKVTWPTEAEWAEIKLADLKLLATEARDLMSSRDNPPEWVKELLPFALANTVTIPMTIEHAFDCFMVRLAACRKREP